jgi:hypothetical protein
MQPLLKLRDVYGPDAVPECRGELLRRGELQRLMQVHPTDTGALDALLDGLETHWRKGAAHWVVGEVLDAAQRTAPQLLSSLDRFRSTR